MDMSSDQMMKMMQRALAPMLQSFGLPADLFDQISKIKIKDFDFELDAETNILYASIKCEDTDSAKRVQSLADTLLARFKERKEQASAAKA